MLTVLIAEQHHIDAIQKDNRLFFEPFFADPDLVFCAWNPEGQTLRESVPALLDTVGRTREWRAVIVHSCSDKLKKEQNPFDEVDHSAISAIRKPSSQPEGVWEEWQRDWERYFSELSAAKESVFRSAMHLPLTQLATWLSFRPADYVLEDVHEKKDATDWAMDVLGEDDKKPSMHLESMERDQYRRELRLKETIRREFTGGRSINIAYPSEIYCISERITENGFFDPEPYWNIHSTNDYSEFVDRNMLFDKMRFMVFDVLPASHRNHRNDRIRFLYTLLVFASNAVPASAMKARRLYSLELDNDETPLCVMATSYEKKLSSTLEVIGNEIDKIKSEMPGELTDKEAAALFLIPADVPVTLDKSCDTDALEVDSKFGLASDWPENESEKWRAGYTEAEQAMAYIIKQQDRSAKKSIGKLSYLSEIDGANVSRLTSFQMDDIREYTDAAEDKMIQTMPPDFSGSSGVIDSMKKRSETVKKVINTRMTKKATLALSAVCIGLFLICLLPLLINNAASVKSVVVAAIMIGVMLVLVIFLVIAALLLLRKPLTNAVRDFNNETTEDLNNVKRAMQDFSGYLSSVCNVRRGNAVLRFCENNPDEYTKSIRIRKKHEEDIKRKRAYLIEDYSDYILDKRYFDDAMIQPYEYDFGMKAEYDYPAPFLAGDTRQVDFLISGNMITVPSSYIKRIMLRMEEIYDR